jgi:hypothetical protein
LTDIVEKPFQQVSPEAVRRRKWRDINKPCPWVFAGEKTKTVQQVCLSRPGFSVKDESPGLFSHLDGLDVPETSFKGSPVYLVIVVKYLLPGGVHSILKKGIGNF